MITTLQSALESKNCAGHPLPAHLCTKMEAAFGANFAQVRIREDPAVHQLGAIAFTHGGHIYFAPGHYNPWSLSGQEILAHELVHVLQQRYGRVPAPAQPGVWVNGDPALEAEAMWAASKAMRGEMVHIPGSEATAPHPIGDALVIQCYTVVPPPARGGLVLAIPNASWHSLNINADTFIGQDKGGHGGYLNSSFLQMGGAGVPNLHAADPANVTLRVSANRQMAIEDTTLDTRQPKVFYATQAIITESNDRLQLLGSHFRLAGNPAQTITIGGNVLLRVLPSNVQLNTIGLTMSCDEPCNQLVGSVIGHNPARLQAPGDVDYETARALLLVAQPPAVDNSSQANRATSMRNITVPYAALCLAPTPAFTNLLQQGELNQYANPEVGEGFLMTSLLAPAVGGLVDLATQPFTYEDHYHLAGGNPKVVHKDYMWNSHWAGVVARDGTDVVTLENYARNRENGALGHGAQQYYFQMYNTNPAVPAQSWFDAWSSIPLNPIPVPLLPALTPPVGPGIPVNPPPTHMPPTPGTKGFANPLAVKVIVPDSHYDAVANRLYGGVSINTIKNQHNQIAGAADAHQEILVVLKGLHYANVHLNDNEKGRKTRVQAWANALTNALNLARFRQNHQAIRYAAEKIVQLALTN